MRVWAGGGGGHRRKHLLPAVGGLVEFARVGYGAEHMFRSLQTLPLYSLIIHRFAPPSPPFLPLQPNGPHPTQPPPRARLCRTRELNVFKGVRRGPSNPQRRLGSGSPPSRFIASVLPKSYFTVPSIRSLGSPQLPSPDAGLSPSLGTRTGHGEREACDTHQQAQHQHQHRQKTRQQQQGPETPIIIYQRARTNSGGPLQGRDLRAASTQPPRVRKVRTRRFTGQAVPTRARSSARRNQRSQTRSAKVEQQISRLKAHQLRGAKTLNLSSRGSG